MRIDVLSFCARLPFDLDGASADGIDGHGTQQLILRIISGQLHRVGMCHRFVYVHRDDTGLWRKGLFDDDIGQMAFAGQGQRAIQRNMVMVRMRCTADELQSGALRPHRVRAGWSRSDAE